MKKLYAEQKHSIYYLQKELGLSKYALYHYTRTHKIENSETSVEKIWFITKVHKYKLKQEKTNE